MLPPVHLTTVYTHGVRNFEPTPILLMCIKLDRWPFTFPHGPIFIKAAAVFIRGT